MKILIIGGTGIISSHVRMLIEIRENDVTVINRGNKAVDMGERVRFIRADINDVETVKRNIEGDLFDVVIDFLCFCKDDVLRRYELFRGKIGQYIFISSATV